MRFIVRLELVTLMTCAISVAACGSATETRPAREPAMPAHGASSYLENPPGAPGTESALPSRPAAVVLGSSNGSSTPNTFATAPASVPVVSPLDVPIASRAGSLTFDTNP